MLLWVTPRPSLEGGATDTPHNLGVPGSRPSRAEVPPLVFGMIAKEKVDDAVVGLDTGDSSKNLEARKNFLGFFTNHLKI